MCSWNGVEVTERVEGGRFKAGVTYPDRVKHARGKRPTVPKFNGSARFKPGHTLGTDVPQSKEHREATRQAALKRAERDYKSVSVNGTVYPNLSRAAKAVGLCRKTLRTRALSTEDIHRDVFYIES